MNTSFEKWFDASISKLFDDDGSIEYQSAIQLYQWLALATSTDHHHKDQSKKMLLVENSEDCAIAALERSVMILDGLHINILCWNESIKSKYKTLLHMFVENVNKSQNNRYQAYMFDNSAYVVSTDFDILSNIKLVNQKKFEKSIKKHAASISSNQIYWVPFMRDLPIPQLYSYINACERIILLDEEHDVHPHNDSKTEGKSIIDRQTLSDLYLKEMFTNLSHTTTLEPIFFNKKSIPTSITKTIRV